MDATGGICGDDLFLLDLLARRGDLRKLENFRLMLAEFGERSTCCASYPVWLTIDPTNSCTLRCPFCPNGFGNITRPRGMMSGDTFARIIDQLGPYLLHIDMQNWGEPLLNKDVYAMIAHAKKYGVHITVSTNFQHFDERSAEALVDSGLDRLIVSIDGASQQTYEKYRRGGSFQTAIDNVRMLVGKKRELKRRLPMIIWQFLVFRHNEHEIETARRMGQELGVDEVGVSPAFIAVDSEEFRNWVPDNAAYSRYAASSGQASRGCSDVFLKPAVQPVCNWPWKGITVNWDGSVSPCCGVYREDEDFGSILDVPFPRLWNNAHYRGARQFIRERAMPEAAVKNTCASCLKIGQINLDLNPDFWIRS